jgi:hypothetical protein
VFQTDKEKDMGWKGVVRSINASARASERNAKRRERELTLQHKHFQKMEALQQAEHEVAVYENRIDLITTMHLDCGDSIDWDTTKSAKEPRQPERSDQNERLAKYELISYKPSLLDKLLRRQEKRTQQLKQNLSTAVKTDEYEHNKSLAQWKDECSEHKQNLELANGILAREAQARLTALKKFTPFGEIAGIGSEIILNADDDFPVRATVRVHSKDIIPADVKALLQTGKLSVKKMPKLRFYELHQDYVCSCAIRVAREIFAILPDEMTIVTAVDTLLDEATGHSQELPILSVAFSRKTLMMLNVDDVDPSDSMQNFLHHMNFKKSSGFSAVEKIIPTDKMRLV